MADWTMAHRLRYAGQAILTAELTLQGVKSAMVVPVHLTHSMVALLDSTYAYTVVVPPAWPSV